MENSEPPWGSLCLGIKVQKPALTHSLFAMAGAGWLKRRAAVFSKSCHEFHCGESEAI